MSKRRLTYSLQVVKENYSYTLQEIADLFSIDLKSAQRWVRTEGLQRIPGVRPYLVHSSELRKFLERRQGRRKKKCNPNEVYCFRCRSPRQPKIGSGKIIFQPNNCVRFQGTCSMCGSRMNRSIKALEWSEIHPLAGYMHDASKQCNGVRPIHPECNLDGGEQLCLNLTL